MKSEALKSIAKEIEQKIIDSGYENVFDFHKKTGVGIAYYTVKRFLDPNERPPSIPTLIEIAHYAGCSKAEIVRFLNEINEPFWHKLIKCDNGGNSTSVVSANITPREAAAASAIHKITQQSPEMWAQITGALSLMAQASGVDCSAELSKLK